MTTNFVARGTDIITQAVEKDNAEEYAAALNLYSQGIQYLITSLKYEKNERVKAAVKEKIGKYMDRAEEIKNNLNGGGPRKKKVKARQGNNGNSNNDDGKESDDDERDAETQALQDSLSQAIVMKTPDVAWDDVAGLEVAKGLLKEAVILPIKFPQLFTSGRKPWKGILLYGPPGTGKSYLAQAVATEAGGSTFFSVSSSDLVSKYVGESEKLVRNLFTLAREKKPSIIFIDEIDSLASKRSDGEQDNTRRIKTEFLVQMNGVGNDTDGVLVLGATNCPWDLDPAIRRRFQKRIYIPLPEHIGRSTMFRIHTKKTDAQLTDGDFDLLADRTEGFSGSDISSVVQDALMEPLRTMQLATHFKRQPNPDDPNDYFLVPCSYRDAGAQEMSLMEIPESMQSKVRAEPLQVQHFMRILENCKPSVGEEDIERCAAWTQEFGQEG